MIFDGCGVKRLAFASHFDLLRNSLLTVSIYADRSELLVFGAPLTSASLSKNLFLDRLERTAELLRRPLVIAKFQNSKTRFFRDTKDLMPFLKGWEKSGKTFMKVPDII